MCCELHWGGTIIVDPGIYLRHPAIALPKSGIRGDDALADQLNTLNNVRASLSSRHELEITKRQATDALKQRCRVALCIGDDVRRFRCRRTLR